MAWSYQLLAGPGREPFDRLSVFAGSFDFASAEPVCADHTIDALDVADPLGSQVGTSMVIAERSAVHTRHRLLETLGQYGEERLDDRGATVEMRDTQLA